MEPAIDVRVHFVFASSALTAQGEHQVRELGRALTAAPLHGYRFRLIGHTTVVAPRPTTSGSPMTVPPLCSATWWRILRWLLTS